MTLSVYDLTHNNYFMTNQKHQTAVLQLECVAQIVEQHTQLVLVLSVAEVNFLYKI